MARASGSSASGERTSTTPWAASTRRGPGASAASTWADGSTPGRRAFHGAPTTSTPPMLMGAASARTVTASGARSAKARDRYTDAASRGSWLPGRMSSGTSKARMASRARAITCRSTWLESNTSPHASTNAASSSRARRAMARTASRRASEYRAWCSGCRNRRVMPRCQSAVCRKRIGLTRLGRGPDARALRGDALQRAVRPARMASTGGSVPVHWAKAAAP